MLERSLVEVTLLKRNRNSYLLQALVCVSRRYKSQLYVAPIASIFIAHAHTFMTASADVTNDCECYGLTVLVIDDHVGTIYWHFTSKLLFIKRHDVGPFQKDTSLKLKLFACV